MEHEAKRGAARGREVRRIVSQLIAEVNVATVGRVAAVFNRQFTPEIDTRAVTLVLQAFGKARRVRPGIFTGPEGNGPILPLLGAVNPTARAIWDAIAEAYPNPVQTRDLAKLTKRDPTKIYPALRLLSQEGLARWQHGLVTATRIHLARSPMLGGWPTDTGVERTKLPPMKNVDVVAPTRTRQPLDEMTDEERERYDDPLGIFA